MSSKWLLDCWLHFFISLFHPCQLQQTRPHGRSGCSVPLPVAAGKHPVATAKYSLAMLIVGEIQTRGGQKNAARMTFSAIILVILCSSARLYSPAGNQRNAQKCLVEICFEFSNLPPFVSLPLYSCHSKPLTDCLCRICRPAPFLLPGSVHVDVPGGRAALHHAGGGVWERALAPTLLLPGGLRGPCANRGCFRCGGLPQLRHRPSVSALWRVLSSQTVWMLQKHFFFLHAILEDHGPSIEMVHLKKL